MRSRKISLGIHVVQWILRLYHFLRAIFLFFLFGSRSWKLLLEILKSMRKHKISECANLNSSMQLLDFWTALFWDWKSDQRRGKLSKTICFNHQNMIAQFYHKINSKLTEIINGLTTGVCWCWWSMRSATLSTISNEIYSINFFTGPTTLQAGSLFTCCDVFRSGKCLGRLILGSDDRGSYAILTDIEESMIKWSDLEREALNVLSIDDQKI